MDMQIIQAQNKNNPGFVYNPESEILKIEGRSIPENPELVFKPLKEWVSVFFASFDKLSIHILLEYINSGSSKHLVEFLKILKVYEDDGKMLDITWFYEEDDEAILELGEYFAETAGLNIKIEMLLE